jgi:hypothetical protein
MNLPGIFLGPRILEYLMNVWDLEQRMLGIPNSQVNLYFRFLGSLTSHYRRFKPDVDPMLNHASNEGGSWCKYKAYSEMFFRTRGVKLLLTFLSSPFWHITCPLLLINNVLIVSLPQNEVFDAQTDN